MTLKEELIADLEAMLHPEALMDGYGALKQILQILKHFKEELDAIKSGK